MKRAIALLLSLMLAFSCLPMMAFAAFSDEANWPSHAAWAKKEIDYLVAKGVLNGYAEDNSFHPEWSVTRSQFIKMMVETFGLTASTSISYADVAATDWHYPYIAKAAAQGFLLNYGSYLDPNGQLTRQEAAALLARYLGLEEKVAVTTYPDYNTINANYRDYVLQATHAGLFGGDAETGNFSPDRILKRCEAAAILYRAAGTIYKTSMAGTEAAAHGENAVIASSGVTVTGANIKGELLITEGASGGTVTLSGCDVEKIILRGTSTLIISGSAVDEIVVDSSVTGYTASVSLTSGTSVDTLTAKTPVGVATVTNTSLKNLNVESTAKNSTVTGAGTLGNATVKATGFTSDPMPSKYTVQSGITAKFNNTSYSGSSADMTATGFSAVPSTYASSAACYLSAKPSVGGTLYYYFTNTAAAPLPTTYTDYYTAAPVKSYLAVTAGASIEQKISDTVNVSNYAYVVVMIQNAQGTKYQPIVLANKASSGLEGVPSVTTTGTYEQMSFKPVVNGTLYYYYTNTETAPTATGFTSVYNQTSTLRKGMFEAAAGRVVIENTFLTNLVADYKYIAVLMTDTSGNQYQPVVFAKDGAGAVLVGSGFIAAPYSDAAATGQIMLGLTPGASGTVEYYYTNTSTVPTAEQFESAYGDMNEVLAGSVSVSNGVAYHQPLTHQVPAKSLPYLVVRLKANSGTAYQPVVVTLPDTASTTLNGSGFASMPVTEVNSGFFSINMQASYVGRVYYYLTDNERAPANANIFKVNYEGATSKQLSVPNGGVANITVGKQLIATPISNEVGRQFPYLVLMIESVGSSLKPIVIPLTGATKDAAVATTTGFVRNPVYTKEQKMYSLTMTPSATGRVWYYFINEPEIPTPEELVRLATIEKEHNSDYGGTVSVIANLVAKKSFSTLVYYPAYVVVMLEDSNGLYYQPVLLSTTNSGTSSGTVNATASGFASLPTAQTVGAYTNLTYNALSAGQVYYYFTNTSAAPTTSEAFFTAHIASSGASGIFSVSAAGAGSKSLSGYGYSYIVLMFQQTIGTQSTFCTPIILSTSGTSSPSVSSSGFYSTPTFSNGVLSYYPTMTGTLYYCFTEANNASDFYSELPGLQGGLTALMSMISGNSLITSVGPKTLNLLPSDSYYAQMLLTYDYVAVWIDNGVTKTDIIFVPTKGITTGATPVNPTPAPANTGLMNTPTVNTTLSGTKSVIINPSVSGSVYYFFTTSTTAYTSEASFLGGYLNSQNGNLLTSVTAGMPQSITVNSSYKYMWIMVKKSSQTSYTPVVVTLY